MKIQLRLPQATAALAAALVLPASWLLADHHEKKDGSPEEAAAPADGFRSLFDGKSLEGWNGDPKFWRVENGEIIGESTEENKIEENTFLIWDQGELDDFVLEVDFKISSEEGNSGIQTRSFMIEDAKHEWRMGGYQADFESGDKWPGLVYGEKYRGILAKRGEKAVFKKGAQKPEIVGETGDPDELIKEVKKGKWNTYRIVAKGNKIQNWINGTLMSELVDEHEEARRSGLLGFQLHQGPPMKVHFKNIRLKRTLLGDKQKVVFLAGVPSHGLGSHEHNAGCELLAKELNENMGDDILATVYRNGWPNDPSALDNADAVVMYLDGGGRHFAKFHLRQLDALHSDGMGLGAIHYGVEIPKGEGLDEFVTWMGGGFETNWSVNPHWDAKFEEFPKHPVANGVKPFTIRDEWYFHMRFRPEMEGVTPILSAHPPKETMSRGDGAHSGNPHVRKAVEAGEIQHVCWVAEAPGKGRGFGFTGGHFHKNWKDDNFRRTALNAITWIAAAEVPREGVPTETPTDEEMKANLDPGQRVPGEKKKPQPKAKPEEKKPEEKKPEAKPEEKKPEAKPKAAAAEIKKVEAKPVVATAPALVKVNAAQAPNTLTDAEKKAGWKLLFDGKSLGGWNNWKTKKPLEADPWKIADGTLALTGGGGGDIYTTSTYESYELTMEWKTTGNSGILLRVDPKLEGPIYRVAPEMQIDNLVGSNVHAPGALFDVYPAGEKVKTNVDGWNSVRILAEGETFTHWMNGTELYSYTIGSDEWKKRIAGSKWKNAENYAELKKGHIGLQDHGHAVSFRNLKIREIK